MPELNQEYSELDDLEVFQRMVELTEAQMEPICGHLRRGQHAKATGCVRATFRIAANIPSNLQHGVFRERGRSFDAIVRFSNSQGTFEPDGTGTARGLAIKLLDVDGARAIPDDGDTTQDFLMVDHPVFPFPDPKSYVETISRKNIPLVGNLAALAHLALLEPKELRILKDIKGKHVASPLRITYWSGAPFWLGPASGTGGHAVKYSAVPRENGSAVPAPPEDRPPDYLSQALSRELKKQEAVFDFKVQLQTDAEKMPVEDVSIEWDENVSSPIAVATLHIAQQRVDGSSTLAVDASSALAAQAESMSFNPWHALAEHRPMGGMNRLRRKVYQASVAKRATGCPI